MQGCNAQYLRDNFAVAAALALFARRLSLELLVGISTAMS